MKIIRSFGYAWEGLVRCLKGGRNFRIQIFAAVIAVALGLFFRITPGEWVAIILCCGMVLTLELINTSIEELSNVVSPSYLAAIKSVKDIAAAAVLLISICSLITGLIIFIPYINH